MTKSSTSRRRELPSDAQMERLLERFFQREVPAELDTEFSLPCAGGSVAAPIRVELTVLAESQSPAAVVRQLPVTVRIAVASSLATIVALLLIVANSGLPQSALSQGMVAGQENGEADVDSERKASSDEDLMLVSPDADQPAGRNSAALGNNGVTLDEADSVDLHPESGHRLPAPNPASKP